MDREGESTRRRLERGAAERRGRVDRLADGRFAMTVRAADLIEQKRNGGEHTPGELAELILAYARDEVPDYQMAAWCMAVYFRGLSAAETHALTDAMVRSGETLDLGPLLGRKVVDKHSTGGVGDKTSIAVGPIVAACGVPLGKMSGRGLGHTGGTLDKLESIPGFRVELTTAELVAQLRDVGVAIVGQSANLVPADKKLYALRDVTATVDIVPLIASSIMSKKLAAGAHAIVLDVKVGDGAFMKSLDDARALAREMLEIGQRAGREVVCLLTDMDQPLGRAVGNALEIRESVETIRGDGPEDFTELVLDACAHLLALSDLGVDRAEGRRLAEAAVADGSAHDVYERWVRAQGGDPSLDALEEAPVQVSVPASREGFVTRLGALAIGHAALDLGAGRRTKEDSVDHAVGVVCFAKRGDRVLAGDDLAEVHARDEASAARAVEAVLAAYELGETAPADAGILLDVVR
jgi:pyrimidine-nucleoside phosphorylase